MACPRIPDPSFRSAQIDGWDPAGHLARETRLARGNVPDTLAGSAADTSDFAATADAFVLRIAPGLRFHYQRGAGVRYSAGAEIDAASVATFHHGSVHGAVAWMNGFVPLHASAVVCNARVHAFAGASGEGKSTLVASLGRRGQTRFADDVVPLEVVPGAPVLALPGHKRLKLWDDALRRLGLGGGSRVWPGVNKFYVDDDHPGIEGSLPLASLTVLEGDADAVDLPIVPIRGAARIMALRDHCYRPDLRPRQHEEAIFEQFARVAASVPMFRFSRPRNLSCFDAGVDRVLDHLASLSA